MPCPAKMQCCRASWMKNNEVTRSPSSLPVCPRSLLLPLPPLTPGTVAPCCPETLAVVFSNLSVPGAIRFSERTYKNQEKGCFVVLLMYSSESCVYKGVRVKSHRVTTHLFLEKYDSSRNSSSLGKAVIFGCHGHTRLVSVLVLHWSRPVAGWRTVQWGGEPLEGELGGLCSSPSSDANNEL